MSLGRGCGYGVGVGVDLSETPSSCHYHFFYMAALPDVTEQRGARLVCTRVFEAMQLGTTFPISSLRTLPHIAYGC